MTGLRTIDRTTLKEAIFREKAAWNRYKGYCESKLWRERGFVRDEASTGLFNEWQILYSLKLDLMGKRRLRQTYRKGGLNLCRS